MFVVLQMLLITAQSFNNFFPSIVSTLGYNDTVTLLLTAPPYFAAFFCSLCISFHAAHKQERGLHIAMPLLFSLLENLLAMYIPSMGGRYCSMFPMTAGSYPPLQPLRLLAKLVTSSSACQTRCRASNHEPHGRGSRPYFYTWYMFPDSQKPRYYAGGGIMNGACLLCAVMALTIKWYPRGENQQMDEEEDRNEDTNTSASEVVSRRLGEEQVLSFRYVH